MARQTQNDKWLVNILQTVNRANCVCTLKLHTLPKATKKAPGGALSNLQQSVFLATDTSAETLLETVDTATGVHDFLLTGVEWVTL